MQNLYFILDNIRSAHNVGAIMRTCDGAGISKLFLTGYTPLPPHPKIIKTALGAESSIPWEHKSDVVSLIKKLKKMKYETVAVEQTSHSINYFDFKPANKSVVFIFGNEVLGVQKDVLDLCDNHIEIPMLGKKNSLNVATTAGIIAYHYKFYEKFKKN